MRRRGWRWWWCGNRWREDRSGGGSSSRYEDEDEVDRPAEKEPNRPPLRSTICGNRRKNGRGSKRSISSSMHVRERAITRRVETSTRIPGHVVIVSAIWRKRSRKRKEIGNISSTSSSSSAIAGCWSTKSGTKRRSNRPKKGDRQNSGARSITPSSFNCYPN